MKIKEVQIVKIAESIVIEVNKREFQLRDIINLVHNCVNDNKLAGVKEVNIQLAKDGNIPRKIPRQSRVGYYTVTIENPELNILNECAGYIAYITHSNEPHENLAIRIAKAKGVVGHFEYDKAIRIKEALEKNTPFRISIKPTVILMDEA